MDDVRLFDLLFSAKCFAALGALLVRYSMAFRCGHLFLNAVLAVFMSAAGVVSYRMGVSDDVIFIVPVWSAALLILRSTGSLLFGRGFFSVYLKSGRTTSMTALIIVNAKNSRSWYFRAISSSVVLFIFGIGILCVSVRISITLSRSRFRPIF